MVGIIGIGWIQESKFGSIFKSCESECPDKKGLQTLFCEKSFLSGPINNFGRFNESSRNICFSAALALHDAGIDYSKKIGVNRGVLGTNEEGCLQSNINYFKDYISSGRKIARGNLFIYTLASTPLSETAIAFGCQGPVAYMAFKENHVVSILNQANTMISQGEASELLVVSSAKEEAICFVLTNIDIGVSEKYVSLDSMKGVVNGLSQPSEVIKRLLLKKTL